MMAANGNQVPSRNLSRPYDSVFSWRKAHNLKMGLELIRDGCEGVNFENLDLGVAGSKLIAAVLRKNLTCRALDLRNNNIGDRGALEIAEMLARDDNTVTYMYLYQNEVSTRGAIAIAEALKENKCLTYLSLSNNYIDDDGVMALADAMERNRDLVYLGLAKNRIQNDGAAAVGEMLKRNRTLVELVLSYNQFTFAGDQALAEGLKKNSTLKYLSVHQDIVSTEGAKAMVEALKVNFTVLYLGMGMSNIANKHLRNKLDRLLQRNIANSQQTHDDRKSIFEMVVKNDIKGPWNRSKIMVIGQGRSGKSATIRSLLGQPFEASLPSTVGASLTQIQTTTKSTGGWTKFDTSNDMDYTTDLAARVTISRVSKRSSVTSAERPTTKGWSLLRRPDRNSNDAVEGKSNQPEGQKILIRERGVSSSDDMRSRVSVPRAVISYIKRSSTKRHTNARQSTSRQSSSKRQSAKRSTPSRQASRQSRNRNSTETTPSSQHSVLRASMQRLSSKRSSLIRKSASRVGAFVQNLMYPALSVEEKLEDLDDREQQQNQKLLPPVLNDEEIEERATEEVFTKATVEQQAIRFTIWDYGGQTIFYTLHHLFLTDFGTYLLVFSMHDFLKDTENAMKYLKFWLYSVKIHAANAPIVVVGTFKDMLESDQDIKTINDALLPLLRKFVQVVSNQAQGLGFFPLNNKFEYQNEPKIEQIRASFGRTEDLRLSKEQSKEKEIAPDAAGGEAESNVNKEIELVRHVIEQVTMIQRHVHQPISSRWTRFLDLLLKKEYRKGTDSLPKPTTHLTRRQAVPEEDSKPKNWMPLSDVLALAHKIHISNEEFDEMMHMFHQLGVLVYLTGTEALKSVVTLNPQWLIDSISKVIRDDTLHQYDTAELTKKGLMEDAVSLFDKGLASRDLLEYLWEPEEVSFLIDLMQQTLLISEYHFNDEPLFLVPAMVKSLDELPYIKAKSRACRFDFSDNYLPTGVFQRLVCLCVGQSGLIAHSRPPLLYKAAAKLWFGERDSFYLFDHEDKIELIVANRSIRSSNKFLHVVSSMLNKIKTEVMGKGLIWKVVLEVSRDEYVDYDEAKAKSLKPWFYSSQAEAQAAVTSVDLDMFMGI